MNCKKGDVALIVMGGAKTQMFVGYVVTCLHRGLDVRGLPSWKVDMELSTGNYRVDFVEDVCLRPLRDNPGQDETLDWAPVPHKEKA